MNRANILARMLQILVNGRMFYAYDVQAINIPIILVFIVSFSVSTVFNEIFAFVWRTL